MALHSRAGRLRRLKGVRVNWLDKFQSRPHSGQRRRIVRPWLGFCGRAGVRASYCARSLVSPSETPSPPDPDRYSVLKSSRFVSVTLVMRNSAYGCPRPADSEGIRKSSVQGSRLRIGQPRTSLTRIAISASNSRGVCHRSIGCLHGYRGHLASSQPVNTRPYPLFRSSSESA